MLTLLNVETVNMVVNFLAGLHSQSKKHQKMISKFYKKKMILLENN